MQYALKVKWNHYDLTLSRRLVSKFPVPISSVLYVIGNSNATGLGWQGRQRRGRFSCDSTSALKWEIWGEAFKQTETLMRGWQHLRSEAQINQVPL